MYKVVSESELLQEAIDLEKNDPKRFKKFLWWNGIDTRLEIEITEDIPHRNSHGEFVTCRRWVGLERTDKEWFDDPRCSFEALYFSSDPSIKIDLQHLSCRDAGAFQKQDHEEFAFTLQVLSDYDINKNSDKNKQLRSKLSRSKKLSRPSTEGVLDS